MFFFPLLAKENVLLDRSLLKKFPNTLLPPMARNRRGNFRISGTADYGPVIKTAEQVVAMPLFSMRYTRLPNATWFNHALFGP